MEHSINESTILILEILILDSFILFYTGKRECVGKALARTNYFLFFTSMIQKYRMEIPKDSSRPSTVPVSGFTTAPAPFKAKLIPRVSAS